MKKILLFCTLLLCFSGVASAQSEVRIVRTDSEIDIDGELTEADWARAAVVTVDYEWFPGDQIAPPVKTDCLLLYGEKHLYVAFKAYDPEPEKIRAHLMDRDSISTFVQDDHISLMIDTFNDQRRAFQFRVNPLGVQADAIFSEIDGIEDFSWDIIWKSAGKITDEGYVVEIALPFNQLRFASGSDAQTWGFEISRSYPRNVRHRMSANPRDQSNNCLLCQLTKVTGFEDLKPGLNLEIVPTLTVNRTDSRPTFPTGPLVSGDEDVELGLSVRWGATPNLTVNATLNPDFSQVEADRAQLAVNQRFALFFPEQRPFFLEGVDFFSTRINAVFTRTIADPKWGAKVTSKKGKNLFGVFAAQDRVNNLVLPSNQGSDFTLVDDEVLNGVVRYRRDLGKSSTVGLLFTGRDGEDYSNFVTGVDSLIRINPKNDLTIQYLVSGTEYPDAIATGFGQPTDSFDGKAFVLDWNRVTRKLVLSAEYEGRDENFRADSGFVPRVDYKRILGVVRRNFWGDPDQWYARIQIGGFAAQTDNWSGQLTDERLETFVSVNGAQQSFAELELSREKIRAGGVLFEELNSADLYAEIQPTGSMKFTLFVSDGEGVDFANIQPADVRFINPGVELKLGRHLNAQLTHTQQTLDVAGGELSEANLSQLRLVYQFDTRMFVRTILQYRSIERDPTLYSFAINAEDNSLFSQLLFSYTLNPQSVIFAGYSDNQLGTELIDLRQADRTFFVKLGYAWTR